MRPFKFAIVLAAFIAAAIFFWTGHGAAVGRATTGAPTIGAPAASSLPAFLPPQARATLDQIAAGGPFSHRQDGVVFGNYEGRLPPQQRGYYHEYTVETPAAGNRGARRIITGGTPPLVYYYTGDHYQSFQAFGVGR